MAALDVVKNVRSTLGSGSVLLAVDAFPLEHAKETPGRRVVRATPHRTHATGNKVGRQKSLVVLRGKVTPAIGVQNDRRASWPLPHCHFSGCLMNTPPGPLWTLSQTGVGPGLSRYVVKESHVYAKSIFKVSVYSGSCFLE